MSLPARNRVDDGRPAIRPARRADIDALVALENAAFTGDRMSRRSFLRLVESASAIALVAESGKALLGACVTLLRASSHRARLYSLAVAPPATGRGIGAALLGAAEEAAFARGSRLMTLEVRDDNEAARALYGKSGFELLGSTPGYYSDGGTALHLRKVLVAPAGEDVRA